jgi:predicted Fe-Mo cluster-binding NifX family protein
MQHGPGKVPVFVRSLGANAILVGGMGPRAVDVLGGMGIEVYTGVQGRVGDAVKAYLTGALKPGTATCSGGHHGHGQGQGHRHGHGMGRGHRCGQAK